MSDPRRAWHVTRADALPLIRERGLIPTIGPRSAELGEPVAAVYLFDDPDVCGDAVTNWLGDAFPEDVALAVIEIDLPENARLRADLAMGGELVCTSPIPPDRLGRTWRA